MFEKLRKWLSAALTVSADLRPASTHSFAPGTRIGYDPELIGRFNEQHQRLLSGFAAILAHAQARRYEALMAAVGLFRKELSEHLLDENVRLYTYLSHCLNHDPSSESLARDMHLEMARIGQGVSSFIRRFTHSGVDDTNVEAFLAESQSIRIALLDRIQREEATLYPLYMRPEEYRVVQSEPVPRALLGSPAPARVALKQRT